MHRDAVYLAIARYEQSIFVSCGAGSEQSLRVVQQPPTEQIHETNQEFSVEIGED